MKKILFILISFILTTACTGYKKLDGEIMRIHRARYAARYYPVGPCYHNIVPTGVSSTAVITKDKILTGYDEGYITEDRYLTTKYQLALEEGFEQELCMKDESNKRKDSDIFDKNHVHNSRPLSLDSRCPYIRISEVTKDDPDFLELFKQHVILGSSLELPAKLGNKILKSKKPNFVFTKEIIEQAIIPEQDTQYYICIAMPQKSNFNDGTDGRFSIPYPQANYSLKERRKMLKDKNPMIYWKFRQWNDFFTEDGKVNKAKIKELTNKN